MQKFKNLKQLILLFGLLMPTVWSNANGCGIADGLSGITINQGIFNIRPSTTHSVMLSLFWF